MLERSVTEISAHLLSICLSLAADTNQMVGTNKCQFGPTKGGRGYHYTVSGGKPVVIAWVGIRTRGIQTDNPKRPCVPVGIKGDLLNKSGSAAGGLVWKPNANFVCQRGGGVGEWHGVTYKVNDNGYKAILAGLVEAAKKSLTRAQGHATWQAKRS
jgi:hypothetical protein